MANHKYLATAKYEDYRNSIRINASSKENALSLLSEEDRKHLEQLVPANKKHFCKYCGSIADGTYEDLLCDECRMCFGHTLYSEL